MLNSSTLSQQVLGVIYIYIYQYIFMRRRSRLAHRPLKGCDMMDSFGQHQRLQDFSCHSAECGKIISLPSQKGKRHHPTLIRARSLPRTIKMRGDARCRLSPSFKVPLRRRRRLSNRRATELSRSLSAEDSFAGDASHVWKWLLTSAGGEGVCALVSEGVLHVRVWGFFFCVFFFLKQRNRDRDDVWVFEEWKETFSRSPLPLNIFVHFIGNKNSKSISSRHPSEGALKSS